MALETAPDEAILDRLTAILWGAALIGSAAITLGGYLIVYFGLAPIRTLAEQTRSLAILSLDTRLETEGIPAELQVLVDHFNDLLNRLEKAYQQLEGFNADVAHELRTPLANIIAPIAAPHPHQHPPMAPHPGPYAHGSARTAPAPMPLAPRRALRALQDDALRAALHGPQGTRQEQAQALGISARTLYRRLRALQTPAAPDPFAVEKPLN